MPAEGTTQKPWPTLCEGMLTQATSERRGTCEQPRAVKPAAAAVAVSVIAIVHNVAR
jgi:hypothetical protein